MQSYEFGNIFSKVLIEAAIPPAIGYLVIGSLTTINPLAGVMFGSIYSLWNNILDPIFNDTGSSPASKIVGRTLSVVNANMAVKGFAGAAFSPLMAVSLALTI